MDFGVGDLLSFSPEEEWEQVLPRWHSIKSTPQAQRLVLAGVPKKVRAKLWCVALTQPAGAEDEASFGRAAAAAGELRDRLAWDWDGSLRKAQPHLDDLMVISADVPRTAPESQRRGTLDGAELQALLDAFVASQLNAEGTSSGGGYTQGMADVGAWLLMHRLPAWQAYASLHALTRRPLLRAVMNLDQSCWDALGRVYTAVLARASPPLAAHFAHVGLMPFFFLPEWLVALWTRSLPPEAAALAWNLLLTEGDGFFCVSCTVGVTVAIGPMLLGCDDLAGCRGICKDAPRTLSVEAFKEAALACRDLNPAAMRPLAPWLDEAKPADMMFEL